MSVCRWPRSHRCRSRQIFRVAKDFCPNFPKLAWKVFCATFAYKFSPTKIMKTFFWCDLQKTSSCAFLQTLGATVWNQITFGAIFSVILPGFSEILIKFSIYQNFWVCAFTQCTPASYTTARSDGSVAATAIWRNRTWNYVQRTKLVLEAYHACVSWEGRAL